MSDDSMSLSADLLHIALADITVIVNIIISLTSDTQSAMNNARQCVSTTKPVVI